MRQGYRLEELPIMRNLAMWFRDHRAHARSRKALSRAVSNAANASVRNEVSWSARARGLAAHPANK